MEKSFFILFSDSSSSFCSRCASPRAFHRPSSLPESPSQGLSQALSESLALSTILAHPLRPGSLPTPSASIFLWPPSYPIYPVLALSEFSLLSAVHALPLVRRPRPPHAS